MMILQINQMIFGLLLGLIIPGFLLASIFFKESGLIERIILGVILSIFIDILLSIFLGYNKILKELTGGIIPLNLWLGLITISLFLLAVCLYRKYKENYFSEGDLISKYY